MATITLKIKGLDGLQRAMKKWPDIAGRETQDALKKSINDVQAETVPITPIDIGRLRSGFRQKVRPFKATLFNTKEYAIYVHEGTGRWPLSRPPRNPGTVRQFLKVGLEKSKKKIEKNFGKALVNTTKEVARRSRF